MKRGALLVGALLAAAVVPVRAAAPEYFMQTTDSQRDVGGLNENDRALYDQSRRNDLTQGGDVSGQFNVLGNLVIRNCSNGVIFCDDTKQTTAASASDDVIQSTKTSNIPTDTGTNTTLTAAGGDIAFSTITLSNVSATSYGQFCVNFTLSKNDDGVTGCSVILNGALFGPHTASANTTRALWKAAIGVAASGGTFGGCWKTTSTLPAGTNTASLVCYTDDATWTFQGPSNNYHNQFVFREVRTAD